MGSMQGLLVIWDNLGIVGVKGSNEKMPAKWYIPRWLGWIFTFGFFNLSLIFFGSSSMTSAIQLFKNIFLLFKNTGYLFKLAANLDIPEFYLIKAGAYPEVSRYAAICLCGTIPAAACYQRRCDQPEEYASDGSRESFP